MHQRREMGGVEARTGRAVGGCRRWVRTGSLKLRPLSPAVVPRFSERSSCSRASFSSCCEKEDGTRLWRREALAGTVRRSAPVRERARGRKQEEGRLETHRCFSKLASRTRIRAFRSLRFSFAACCFLWYETMRRCRCWSTVAAS